MLEDFTDEELKSQYTVAYRYANNLKLELIERGLVEFAVYDGIPEEMKG